jgi:hypothetical protein
MISAVTITTLESLHLAGSVLSFFGAVGLGYDLLVWISKKKQCAN